MKNKCDHKYGWFFEDVYGVVVGGRIALDGKPLKPTSPSAKIKILARCNNTLDCKYQRNIYLYVAAIGYGKRRLKNEEER